MDEPIRFADILFTALTLLITGLILYAVNKGRQKKQSGTPETSQNQTKEDS